MPKTNHHLSKVFAQTRYGGVVDRLVARAAQRQSSGAQQAIATEIKPVFPNAGSQSKLVFDVLGFQRGERTSEVAYDDGQIKDIEAILGHHNWALPHPEALAPKIELPEIDFSKGINPKARRILVRCGNGNGKTTIGAVFDYGMAIAYPESIGLIIANTYDQLAATIEGYLKFYLAHDIPFEPWRGDIQSTIRSILSLKTFTVNGSVRKVRSADSFTGGASSFQAGRGMEIGHVQVDEGLRLRDATLFKTLSTRVRMPGVPSIILITSTINTDDPFNWGYDYFDNPDTKRDGFVSITGSSVENLHRLSRTYIQDMYQAMTPDLFRIEVLGEYVGVTTGKLFKYFSRDLHVFPPDYMAVVPNEPIYLSFDFNWNPSTAIAAQFVEGELRIIREWHLTDSNTFELAEAVLEWLEPYQGRDLIITGDASGGQKTANSRQTNWQIIANTLRHHRTQYVYPKANPSIQDTVNAVNTGFYKDRILLSADCKELIKDLESAAYPYEDFKKKYPERSHWLDELRYLTDYVLPYEGSRKSRLQTVAGVGLLA